MLLVIYLILLIQIVHARKQICVASRKLCISSVVNGTNVDFSITFSTPGWVSFGLSPSGSMSNADVAMVWSQDVPGQGKMVQVSDRTSSKHGVPDVDAGQQDWNVVTAEQTTGASFTATLRRAITASESADYSFKNEDQKYIWALSTSPVPIQNDRPVFGIHTERGTFDFNALDPSSTDGLQSVDASPGVSQATALMVHVVCMALAWGFFSYISVFVARFMKYRLPELWFPIHWISMVLVAVLTMIGVITMALSAGNRWFSSAHTIVGTMVFVAMWAQIILGLVIHKMYDPERKEIPGRDSIHHLTGYILALGGPTAILLGLLLVQASNSVLGAYIVTWVVFMVMFAIGDVKHAAKTK